MTGATVPWVPGSGVGRRPHRGRGPDALPANYLLLCVCITSSALVVRTLGLVHLRTGSSDRGYLSRGSLAVSQVLGTVRFLCVEICDGSSKEGKHLSSDPATTQPRRLPLHIVTRRQQNSTFHGLSDVPRGHAARGKGGLREIPEAWSKLQIGLLMTGPSKGPGSPA